MSSIQNANVSGVAPPETKYTKSNAFNIDEIKILTSTGEEVILTPDKWKVIDIYEDLFSNYVYAEIRVIDAQNLLRHGPIIGQELVTIRFNTPGTDKRQKTFRIHKVTDKVYDDTQKVQYYKLNLVSQEAFGNLNEKVNYSLRNMSVERMVAYIFGNHFPQSNIEISAYDKNTHSFVFPNRSPVYSINWLAKRAVNIHNTADSSFIFYEDLDGFHFNTVMNLMRQKPQGPGGRPQSYQLKAQNVRELPTSEFGKGLVEGMNNPGKIDFNKTYDKFSEAKKGMYASTLAVYDIVTKQYTARTYDYLEHFNALYDRDNTVQPMISLSGNERLNEKSNSLIHYKPSHLGLYGDATIDSIKENPSVYDNDKYHEYLLERKSLEQQIASRQGGCQKLVMDVPGDSTKRVGQTIELIVPSPEPHAGGEDFIEEYVSGRYLITSIKHTIDNLDYIMTLELTRNTLNSTLPTAVDTSKTNGASVTGSKL
tara:strand:+ start:15052 stop:16494 length:1443 start_codon:yes stop_codon:yes gene_type:complete